MATANPESTENTPQFIKTEIPKIFHSYSDEKPFDTCLVCQKSLLDPSTHYIIEKALKKYDGFSATDTIFEFAICLGCIEEMREEMSMESMRNINAYFEGHADLFRRRKEYFEEKRFDPEDWTNECLISGCAVEDTQEYQIYAHCAGSKLNLGLMPYMISGPVMAEMADLISKKTQDELDSFSDEHFGLPPEWREAITTRGLILV